MVSALRQSLPTFGHVAWVMTTGSTNTDLLSWKHPPLPHKPWLLGTHFQQASRGRAGRTWQNPAGCALTFSCAFDTALPTMTLPVLSPLAGLAACEALRHLAGLTCDRLRVKWPNDVLWDDAKLAGILVETRRHPGTDPSRHTVVIGMGLNLSDSARLSHELSRPIADWCQIDATTLATELVASVAQAWQRILIDVYQYGFGAFVERFQQLDGLIGRKVQVIDQSIVHHQGTAQGIDVHGRLVVQTATGPVAVSVGDISVRPN
jgi:BirA family biotin operon repressor/biotin-[acetyl-CoA-carboxylase] ligase